VRVRPARHHLPHRRDERHHRRGHRRTHHPQRLSDVHRVPDHAGPVDPAAPGHPPDHGQRVQPHLPRHPRMATSPPPHRPDLHPQTRRPAAHRRGGGAGPDPAGSYAAPTPPPPTPPKPRSPRSPPDTTKPPAPTSGATTQTPNTPATSPATHNQTP